MSTLPVGEEVDISQLSLVKEPSSGMERFFASVTDRLNPILVREARQSLKNRQFSLTFGLMLIAAVFWTFLGISLMLPGIYYLPSGGVMLIGYYLIILVPALLVVPFGAYRSLAAEMEEGTYDLLSITSLSSIQVVLGKLCSSFLQLIVYFSALTPCIAFTYLLRGVDLSTLIVVLGGSFFLSLLMAVLGLLLATLGRNRAVQVFVSIALLGVLALVAWFWFLFIMNMYFSPFASEFALDLFAWTSVIAFYTSYMVLGILSAAGMISFASENKSTRLRIIMSIQQLMFLFWGIGGFVYYELPMSIDRAQSGGRFLIAIQIISSIHWAVMGTLILGEAGVISPRAKRSLPSSLLGRMLFIWFNPGAGVGYVFVIINYIALSITTIFFAWLLRVADSNFVGLVSLALLVLAYLAFYLGLTRLILLMLGERLPLRMLVASVLVIVELMLFSVVPLMIGFWLNSYQTIQYSALHAFNVMWTIAEVEDGRGTAVVSIPIVALAGIILFIINYVTVTRDVLVVRIETPERVLAETGKLKPKKEQVVIDPLAPDS